MDYQSRNNFIERLEAKNIPVTWTFLLIGLMGPGRLPSQLSFSEIADYALKKAMETPNDKLIKRITYAEPDEKEIVENTLRLLSAGEPPQSKIEDIEKWEILLLEDLLEVLPEDSIKGLTDLTSFWSQFNFPNDSPHEVQGQYNNIPPEYYYTKDYYQKNLTKHREWIEKKEENLRRCS